jgi:hypothetical protein
MPNKELADSSHPLDKSGLLLLKEELSTLVAVLLPDAPDVLSTGVANVG